MSAFPFSSSSSSTATFSFRPSSSSYSSAPSNPPTSASTPSFFYGFTSNSSNSSFSFTPSSSSSSSAPTNAPTFASTPPPSFSFGFTSNSSSSSMPTTFSSSAASPFGVSSATAAALPSFSTSSFAAASSAAPFSSRSPLFGNLSIAPFSSSQLYGTSSFSSGLSTTPSFSLSPIRASSSVSTAPAFSSPPLFSSTSASSFPSSFGPFPKTSAPSASAPLSLSTPSTSTFTFSFSTPSPASGFSLSSSAASTTNASSSLATLPISTTAPTNPLSLSFGTPSVSSTVTRLTTTASSAAPSSHASSLFSSQADASLLGATSGPSTGFTSTTTSASAASSGATTSFPSFSLSTKESAATAGSSTAPVFDFSMSASAGLSTEGAARISFFTSSATTTQPLSLVSAPSSGGMSSTVSATQSSAPKLPSEITGKIVEEVTEALARAGFGSSNLIVGIDFTKSNEWTGKWSFNNRSLHYIGDHQNPYEQAISIIGRTLSAFDEDNSIPCFGFDGAITHFSFYPDGRFWYGFEEALEALKQHREVFPRLAGPTSFAPIIEMAIDIVEESGGQYHVLIIITDGQVTRSVDTSPGHLSPQEKDTMDAIVRASEYPLSIILVGVGDGPWDTMKEFDDNIPARAFDNFQFVNFTEIMLESVPLSKKETEFALAALMKIPSQYKATIELKILGHRTGNSLERVSLPPHLIDGVPSSFSSFKPCEPTYCPSYDTPVGSSPPVSSARNNQDCPICLTNPKDMAFGCGHQTCSECAPSLKSCPMCRSPIQIKIKLY